MIKAVGALLGVLLVAGAVYAYDATATAEIGFRGVGMQVTEAEGRLDDKLAANEVPPSLPAPADSGVLAVDEYENVKVLGHLNTAQFTRLMTAITTWVSPEQGCAYCHNTENMASDELYTKVVSRRMIQQTMHINENWQQHVQETGVTCYTCHRGQPVPAYIWFDEEEGSSAMLGYRAGQNSPSDAVGLASLPGNVFETYLNDDTNIRVQAGEPIPESNRSSIKQAEWTYGLMMHFSTALGVNCTYCHNSRSWADWRQSPIQRTTAWYGIRMVRNLNHAYLEPLQEVFPDNRLGPNGDVPKTNCGTCHHGAYKPLLGYSMLEDYPSLARAVVPQPQPKPTYDVQVTDDRVEITGKIHFATGSAEILESSHGLLDAINAAIGGSDIRALRVIGHTDVTGDVEGNQLLSQQRATSVVAYLRDHGATVAFQPVGAGETRPLCRDATPECNQRNRRVEFLITARGAQAPAGTDGESDDGTEGAGAAAGEANGDGADDGELEPLTGAAVRE